MTRNSRQRVSSQPKFSMGHTLKSSSLFVTLIVVFLVSFISYEVKYVIANPDPQHGVGPTSISNSGSSSEGSASQAGQGGGRLSLLDGRVHSVANFVGGEAVLLCDVDLYKCGKIYFITWTKNVSNEWQRVYLWRENFQKALGDFSGYDSQHITFSDSTASQEGVVSLRLHHLAENDEGTYKCDVTYVHGKCPSLTYTRLYTLGKCDLTHIECSLLWLLWFVWLWWFYLYYYHHHDFGAFPLKFRITQIGFFIVMSCYIMIDIRVTRQREMKNCIIIACQHPTEQWVLKFVWRSEHCTALVICL